MNFKKILFTLLLLVGSCFGQFNVTSRGPISGPCAGNPKLGIDFVNNDLYSCPGSLSGNTIGVWAKVGSSFLNGTPTHFSVFTSPFIVGDSSLIETTETITSIKPIVVPTEPWSSNGTNAANTQFVVRGYPVLTPHGLQLQCANGDEGSLINSTLASVSQTYGGGTVQYQVGDYCNMGTTVFNFPPGIRLIGQGIQYSGDFSIFTPAASMTLGCPDTNPACITAITYGNASAYNLAFINNTTDTPFLLQTKMVLNMDMVSFTGMTGSRTTRNAVNDVFIFGQQQNGTITCNTDIACGFKGYQTVLTRIYTNKVRRGAVFNTCAQEITLDIHTSALDSNGSVDTDGTGAGPYIDMLGDGGGTQCKAIQNHITAICELGNPSGTNTDGDLHFNTCVRGDNAVNNEVNVVADDSPSSPHNATAAFVMTANASQNKLTALQYQSGKIACFSDALATSYSNQYYCVPAQAVYSKYIYGQHVIAQTVQSVSYYSAGGTPVPTCNSANLTTRLAVSDATVATPGSTYTSGGTISIWAQCIYNSSGSVYTWIID